MDLRGVYSGRGQLVSQSSLCQEGRRAAAQGLGSQRGPAARLIESRWAVLELSFERREGEEGDEEEAFWAGNNFQMKTRRHGVIME